MIVGWGVHPVEAECLSANFCSTNGARYAANTSKRMRSMQAGGTLIDADVKP